MKSNSMEIRDVLYSLVRCSIGTSEQVNLSGEQLYKVMLLGRQQGISAVVFDGYQKAKKQLSSSLGQETRNRLKSEWLSDLGVAMHSSEIIHQAESIISEELKKNNIKALLLKGSVLAHYYETKEFRQFGDIDIYSPTEFEKIDDIIRRIGNHYKLDCYRHSQCLVNGITVENHFFLTDARWKKKWAKLEEFLSQVAKKDLQKIDNSGLLYPDEMFSIVFYLYHTQAHFVYEHINVRFLLDWYYLMKNREHTNEMELAARLQEFGLMKIAGYVTAMCIKRLGVKEDFVPSFISDKAKHINPILLKRFEEDMFDTSHTGFTSNSFSDRFKRLFTFYHGRWKINEFLDISLMRFVGQKVLAIYKWH